MHTDVTSRRALPMRTGLACCALLAVALTASACSADAPSPGPATASSGAAGMTSAKAPDCLPSGTQAVAVTSGDVTTAVAVTAGGSQGVVLAPQNGGDWCQWASEAKHLVSKGYRVATFTWPGTGNIKGEAAMRSAVDALHQAGVEKVALVGASKGGTYVVAMAQELGAVGVVALSPPSRFEGMDARSTSVDYTGPLLVLASRDDPDVARDDSQLVSRPAEGPSFFEVPLAAHGVAMLADPDHHDHVEFLIDDELTRSFAG